MDQQATGLILRTRPLTDSSLVVHWLTQKAGRLATVAKGARRPKSPFKGKLDIFFRGNFSFRRNPRGDLHLLREVALEETFQALRSDLARLQQAAYAALLLERATESDTPIPELYELMLSFLRHLEGHPPRPLTILALEMKMLGKLGLAPDPAQTPLSSGAKALLQRFGAQDWEPLLPLRLSSSQWHELERFLHSFLLHHLDHVPSARQSALGGSP